MKFIYSICLFENVYTMDAISDHSAFESDDAIVFVFAIVRKNDTACASCAFCRGPIFPGERHRCPEQIFCFVRDQPDDDDAPSGVGILVFLTDTPPNQSGETCVLLRALLIPEAAVGAATGETREAVGTTTAFSLLARLLRRSTEEPAVLWELLETPMMSLVPFEPVLSSREIQARAIAAGVLRVEETEDVGFIKPGHENCFTCGTGSFRQERLLLVARNQRSRLRPHLLVVPSAKGRNQGRCGICFDDFERHGEPISMVHDHGHFYHSACINMWFDQCERKPGTLLRYTCPLCALEIV